MARFPLRARIVSGGLAISVVPFADGVTSARVGDELLRLNAFMRHARFAIDDEGRIALATYVAGPLNAEAIARAAADLLEHRCYRSDDSWQGHHNQRSKGLA